MRKIVAITLTTFTVGLSACGGGGSSSTSSAQSPTSPTSPPSANRWTQGQFASAPSFKNECAVPRQGSDAQGNRFPDTAGTLSDELFWLRSWSNETYLWYNEITDRDPNAFSNTLSYFDELKTTAVTASGRPKDRFHFTYDTADWLQIRTSGNESGYGAEFVLVQSSPPRDIRVAYIEPGSPAATAGLARGDRIVSVDGIDAINGTNTNAINAGLFPDNSGETHTLNVRKTDGTTRSISLSSATVAQQPVNDVRIVEQNGRRYGYVHFTTFSPRTAEEQLFDAFDILQAGSVDDLVLDLRYNGGGLLAIASQLSYMVAGPNNVRGKNFETLQFNNKAGGTNPVTGEPIRPTPFYTAGVGFTVPESRSAPTVSKSRVFVLTTGRSCSASEAVINGLRGIDVEVIQIGSRTCGKPYGFYATDNCGTTFFTIQFRGVNNKNFGDFADGFAPGESADGIVEVMPGCTVADDYSNALGDPDEALFSTAITYAETGACPAATTVFAKPQTALDNSFIAEPALDLRNDPRVQAIEIARSFGQD